MLFGLTAFSQKISQSEDSLHAVSDYYTLHLSKESGQISYSFPGGTRLENTIAVVRDHQEKLIATHSFTSHGWAVEEISDKIGKGTLITFSHFGGQDEWSITQYITLYEQKPFFLVGATAERNGENVSSNYFSPLSISTQSGGSAFVPGTQPRVMDVPYDNDNWTKLLTVKWSDSTTSGTGYNFTALYDYETMHGLVLGNVSHDFWKTGIHYSLNTEQGTVDSFTLYGGASAPDNKALPSEYGGYDGTHDVVAHGSMQGHTLFSPLFFMGATENIYTAFREYGQLNATISGALSWKGDAPVYWNSFGVEDVLGHRNIMMPGGVARISDYLHSLQHFNAYAQPTLSIDSYDQGIYSTEVLKTIAEYGEKRNQQMGFYFIPFAIWTWKSGIYTNKLQHTDAFIRDVASKDEDGKIIIYKDGDFGAYPLDPTHPATRERIIAELKKAKAIHARFLKIDFLTAGALESKSRYNKNIHSGLQAYHYGMNMLAHLIDSILGPDIFITHAISPTFPAQFAHARFLSTDIYSHFRDDTQGFPHHGSTAGSMITNSHLGWMQGTLLPYSNLDVLVMKNFQKNPDLSERDIRVRLFSLMSLGSILGDGSDFRNKTAAERGRKYLNHPNVTAYFAKPRAFIPIKVSDGLSEDQQLSFYLPGDTFLISAFNFDLEKEFAQSISRKKIGLEENRPYLISDFLTGKTIGSIPENAAEIELTTPPADAIMVKLIPADE